MTIGVATADRRIVLLLGSPRSGTSWLANILNSYHGVLYSHEPLSKLPVPALTSIRDSIVNRGVLEPEARAVLLSEWSKAYPISRRPPFFAKDFLRTPPSLQWLSWLVVRALHRGHGVFRKLFSPAPQGRYDLLIKEIGWAKQAQAIVGALAPELILIFRHPCAVVASQLQGKRLGLLYREERTSWLESHGSACEDLGFSRDVILAMEEYEWLAVWWLLTNRAYLEVLKTYPRTHVVVYEALCSEPLRVSQGVFDFLGWQLGPQTRAFLQTSTHGSRSSLATMLLGQHSYFSIYRDSRESMLSYENTLTEAQQERIVALIKPHFPYDAYWPSANGKACPAAAPAARVAVP
jgi:hypothetical protein